jgi:predicted nucleotidyltransferase
LTPDPVSVETVYAVVRVLRDQGIEFAFVGGLALSAWGVPRATFDLDLAVALPADRQRDLLSALRILGWSVDEVFERGWRDEMAGIPLIHVRIPADHALIRVDLLIADTPFLQSVLARRIELDLGQGKVPICSAADLVLFKLIAWRRKDRVDLDNILWVQGVPERTYLEHWARILGVEERLRQVLTKG